MLLEGGAFMDIDSFMNNVQDKQRGTGMTRDRKSEASSAGVWKYKGLRVDLSGILSSL